MTLDMNVKFALSDRLPLASAFDVVPQISRRARIYVESLEQNVFMAMLERLSMELRRACRSYKAKQINMIVRDTYLIDTVQLSLPDPSVCATLMYLALSGVYGNRIDYVLWHHVDSPSKVARDLTELFTMLSFVRVHRYEKQKIYIKDALNKRAVPIDVVTVHYVITTDHSTLEYRSIVIYQHEAAETILQRRLARCLFIDFDDRATKPNAIVVANMIDNVLKYSEGMTRQRRTKVFVHGRATALNMCTAATSTKCRHSCCYRDGLDGLMRYAIDWRYKTSVRIYDFRRPLVIDMRTVHGHELRRVELMALRYNCFRGFQSLKSLMIDIHSVCQSIDLEQSWIVIDPTPEAGAAKEEQ